MMTIVGAQYLHELRQKIILPPVKKQYYPSQYRKGFFLKEKVLKVVIFFSGGKANNLDLFVFSDLSFSSLVFGDVYKKKRTRKRPAQYCRGSRPGITCPRETASQ